MQMKYFATVDMFIAFTRLNTLELILLK